MKDSKSQRCILSLLMQSHILRVHWVDAPGHERRCFDFVHRSPGPAALIQGFINTFLPPGYRIRRHSHAYKSPHPRPLRFTPRHDRPRACVFGDFLYFPRRNATLRIYDRLKGMSNRCKQKTIQFRANPSCYRLQFHPAVRNLSTVAQLGEYVLEISDYTSGGSILRTVMTAVMVNW